jgi:hypothetical protein
MSKSKYELFETTHDNDHELIDKTKKVYLEQSEESFIDHLIFCRLESLSKLFQLKYLI